MKQEWEAVDGGPVLGRLGVESRSPARPVEVIVLTRPCEPAQSSVRYLRTRTSFSCLTDEAFRAIEERLEWFWLDEEEVLFEAGDEGDRVYFPVHGRLAILQERQGRSELCAYAGPGESIGEMGLVAGETRTATVRATRETLVASLSRQSYDEVSREEPAALAGLVELLADRLRSILNPRHRHGSVVDVIAVVPATEGVPIRDFTTRLVSVLEREGKVSHLTAARIDETHGSIARDPALDSNREEHLLGWLNEQETRHRFLVLEADSEWSPWTERCIRFSDQHLIVARASPGTPRGILDGIENRAGLAMRPRKLVMLHESDESATGTAGWLDRIPDAEPHHIRLGVEADFARLGRLLGQRSVSLALSGGGAFTFAQIGVMRALEEAGQPVDLYCGASMGAILACQGALGLDWRTIRDNSRRHFRGLSIFDYTLPVVSLCRGRRLDRRLESIVGDLDIEDLRYPFFCVSSNLTHSRPEVHRRGSLRVALRATSALAGIFPPVFYQDSLLADGALVNNLPADLAREIAPGPSIAVNVIPTTDRVTKARSGPLSTWKTLRERLTRPEAEKPPIITDIFFRMALLSAIQRAEENRERASLYIEPDLSRYNFMKSGNFDDLVEAGYRAAIEQLEDWSIQA